MIKTPVRTRQRLDMKRVFDVLVAGTALLLVSPICAIIVCAIRMDDHGAILFRGVRIGQDGVPFEIFKFRSMRQSPGAGLAITVAGDDRITRVGRILRATKLDELPQLLNVLRGEMSLVGPRPESPVYVARYSEEQQQVLSVRPGLTGAAQIYFRHEEAMLAGPNPEQRYLALIMPAKLAIDLDYVRKQSLLLDLKLLALTLLAIVKPAEQPGDDDDRALRELVA